MGLLELDKIEEELNKSSQPQEIKDIFKELKDLYNGVPITSTEDRLKELLTKDEKTIKFFSEQGINLLTPDGKIDREKIMNYSIRGGVWEDGSYRSELHFNYEAERLIIDLQSMYGYPDFVDRLFKKQ